MIIKEVYLKGYKVFKNETSLSFDKGFVLFLGRNGKGKSTINSYVDLNLLNLTEEETDRKALITRGEDKCDSYLIFEHHGIIYKSHLTIEKKGKTADTARVLEDLTNNKIISDTTTGVVAHLNELFDPVISKFALALRQENREVITCKPAERFKIFQKVLDVEFNRSVAKIVKEISDYKDRLANLDGQLEAYAIKDYTPTPLPDRTYAQEEIENLKIEKEEISKQLILAESTLEKYNSINSQIDSNANELTSIHEGISRKRSDIESTRSQIVAEADISDHSSLIRPRTKIIRLKKELAELDEQAYIDEALNSLSEDEKRLSGELSTLNDKLDAYPRTRPLRDNTEETREKISQIDKEILQHTNKLETIESKISFQSKGVCSECGTKIDDSKVPELQLEAEYIGTKKSELSESLLVLKSYLVTTKEALAEQAKKTKEKDALTAEIDIVKSKFEGLEDKKSTAVDTAKKNYSSEKQRIETAISTEEEKIESIKEGIISNNKIHDETVVSLEKDKEELVSKRITLEEKGVSLTEELSEIKVVPTEDLKSDLSDINSKLTEHDNNIEEINKVAVANNLLEKSKVDDAKKIDELNVDRNEVDYQWKLRVDAKAILEKELPKYIISETVQEITSNINRFIGDIYDKDLDISLKNTATSLKMLAGGITVRSLSGAEKAITSLGFVDALRVYSSLEDSTVILDEVDAPLDQPNALALFGAIENLPYEQIFITTHSDYMKDHFMNKGAQAFVFSDSGVEEGV